MFYLVTVKQYDWKVWKFKHATKGYWEDENNCKLYIDWLTKELKIKKPEDWYTVTTDHIR